MCFKCLGPIGSLSGYPEGSCAALNSSMVGAAAEFVEIQQSFTAFVERHNQDPTKVHPDLTDCELRSLARVSPRVLYRARE